MIGRAAGSTPRLVAPASGPGTRALAVLAIVSALVVCMALSVTLGTRDVGWAEILSGLEGRTSTIAQAAVAARIPRTLLAGLAGASLGLAGAVMQGVTRNPLADPGILGVNMGASLAVVAGVAWFDMSSPAAFLWSAMAGAAAATIFVYRIGSLGPGGSTPLKLTLTGAATSIACASLVIAVVMPRADIADALRSWQVGSVGGATYGRILPVLPATLAGFAVSLLCARKLNSLALGDDVAAGLGERVGLTRAVASLGGVLLCGATTAMCGPIAFVGLVVPHVCRLLFGVDYRWLLPLSALGGACLLVAADVMGRLVARPAEINVSIVTALIGAPVFIWIVRRRRVREL